MRKIFWALVLIIVVVLILAILFIFSGALGLWTVPMPGCTQVTNRAYNCHLFSCSEAPECCGTTYATCGVYSQTTDCQWYENQVLVTTLSRGQSRLIPSGKQSNMIEYECGACVDQCDWSGWRCSGSSCCLCDTSGQCSILDCSRPQSECCSSGYSCVSGSCQSSCTDESPCTALTNGQWYCDPFSSTEFQCANCDGDTCIDKCNGMSCIYGCTGSGWGYRCSSCQPTTCAALGKNCGSWSNGCGGTLNCGTCPSGQACTNGVCTVTCTNECTTGQTRCTDINTMESCADYDSDGCLEWGGSKTCAYGCVNDICQGEVSGTIDLVFLGTISVSIIGGIVFMLLKIFGKI